VCAARLAAEEQEHPVLPAAPTTQRDATREVAGALASIAGVWI
jgi:hypothetical protein